MNDITQEWLYTRIGEASNDAFVFSDRDGIIRLWNAGAEALFGYPADEALGQSLDLIIPENLRARHWEGYRTVMQTAETRYGTELLSAPSIRRDGTRISVEFSMTLLRHPDGSLFGTGAIIRDVTARWQKEKAMKDRLAALEAQAKE